MDTTEVTFAEAPVAAPETPVDTVVEAASPTATLEAPVEAPVAPVIVETPVVEVAAPVAAVETAVVETVTDTKPAKKKGRISSDVTSLREMRSIFTARKNGLSFDKIEQVKKFNLRSANGMTAYRVCKKYAKLHKAAARKATVKGKAKGKKAA